MNKFLLLLLAGLLILPVGAGATIDCNHAVTSVQWLGKPNLGLRLRDKTCMDSNVVSTLRSGVSYKIIGEADGWYKIQDGNNVGFVWGELMTVTNKNADFTNTQPEVTKVEPKPELITETKKETTPSTSLLQRVRGYILLQVESRGEAWYVHPVSGKRYYMRDGATAYQMMRSFGLGITNADLARAQKGDESVSPGRICR